MVKVEEVKQSLLQNKESSLRAPPKVFSRKKIFIEQNNEIFNVLNHLKNNMPSQQ